MRIIKVYQLFCPPLDAVRGEHNFQNKADPAGIRNRVKRINRRSLPNNMKLGMSYARCGYSNIEPPALVRLRFSVSADGKTAESA